MCTSVNKEHFRTVHHEMGHIQYYIQYKQQPVVFREGGNPGKYLDYGDWQHHRVFLDIHFRCIYFRGHALIDMLLENL